MGEVTPFPLPGSGSLCPPEPITAAHDLSGFDCGQAALNDWLRRRALANNPAGASRTYVVACAGTIVGFYCLSAGSIFSRDATGRVRRNMPDPIPVMVLGRLAVDVRWGGQGIGAGMLKDAVIRSLQVADIAGVRALLVHAKDPGAAGFYAHFGFQPSPLDPLTLMITLQDAAKALG